MPYGSTRFRATAVKPYRREDENIDDPNANMSDSERSSSDEETSKSDCNDE